VHSQDPAAPEIASPPWAAPLAWALAAGTGLALLAISAGPHRIGDYYTETDFYGGYAEGARLIQHGHWDAARYGVIGPVYEIALALAGFVTRDLFLAAQAISLGAAVAALLLWFALLRRRAGDALALVVVAYLAGNPTFFRYGYSATTDMLAFGLEAAALFAILGMRWVWAPLAAGALSALAALTRYSAIALLPGAIFCYAGLAPVAGAPRRRAVILYLGGFALVALPWIVLALRAGVAPGALLFHDIAYDIYANARGTTWAEYQTRLQPGFHSILEVLRRDPAAVLRREGSNLLTHVRGDAQRLLGWPVAATCVLGSLLAFRDRATRKLAALWVLGGLCYLTLIPAFYSERYSLVLAPFYLTLTGIMATSPWLGRRARVGAVPVPLLLACIPLALSMVTSVTDQRATLADTPREVLRVAPILSTSARTGARVMALKPHIAYYSGLAFTPMPATHELSALADSCRRLGVEHLYYSWLEANNRPSFWYLLDPEADVPGLEREMFVTDHPAALYRIGPAFGAAPAWLASDSARARSESRVLTALPPRWVWRAHLSMAVAAFDEQRFREVFDHASVVIRDQPREPLGWRLYADASLRRGDRDRAIVAFERALALEPGSIDTRVRLGWLLLGAGRPDRAAEIWRSAAGMTSNRATLERMVALFHSRGDAGAERRARAALERRGE
jgi:tetratricopeptide repeat protein